MSDKPETVQEFLSRIGRKGGERLTTKKLAALARTREKRTAKIETRKTMEGLLG